MRSKTSTHGRPPSTDLELHLWAPPDRPRLRKDLVMKRRQVGKTQLCEMKLPDSQSICTLYDFELSLARLMDGTRDHEAMVHEAHHLGLVVTAEELRRFVRDLAAYRFIENAMPLPLPYTVEPSSRIGLLEPQPFDSMPMNADDAVLIDDLPSRKQPRPEGRRPTLDAGLSGIPRLRTARETRPDLPLTYPPVTNPPASVARSTQLPTAIVDLPRGPARGGRKVVLALGLLFSMIGAAAGVWVLQTGQFREVVVRAPVASRVARVVARPGEWVPKGMVLAMLESPELRAQTVDAESIIREMDSVRKQRTQEVAAARRAAKKGVAGRRRALAERRLRMAEVALERVEARLAAARERREELGQKMKALVLRALVAGRVRAPPADLVGRPLAAGEEVLSVAADSR